MASIRISPLRWPWLALLLFGCGSTSPPHKHSEPLSATAHEEHAQVHESQAESSTERVNPYSSGGDETQCVDVGGPLQSDGESTPVMKPCWTMAEQNASFLRAADSHRLAAADHREWAAQLVIAERESCQSLGKIERSTSPFVRSPDILSVKEYRESKTLRGAQVTFRKVPGLSKEWLGKSIQCHSARAAKLGYAKDFMPHCPLTLRDTASSMTETEDTITVTLRSKNELIAAQIYGRALHAASDEPQK